MCTRCWGRWRERRELRAIFGHCVNRGASRSEPPSHSISFHSLFFPDAGADVLIYARAQKLVSNIDIAGGGFFGV